MIRTDQPLAMYSSCLTGCCHSDQWSPRVSRPSKLTTNHLQRGVSDGGWQRVLKSLKSSLRPNFLKERLYCWRSTFPLLSVKIESIRSPNCIDKQGEDRLSVFLLRPVAWP